MHATPDSPPERPHLVMLVGNHVVGDSRVEKSAVSAVNAGYRVSLLGTRHRSVFPLSRYEDVPIHRIPADFARHRAWAAWNRLRPERRADWSLLVNEELPPAAPPDTTGQHQRSAGRLTERLRNAAGRFLTTPSAGPVDQLHSLGKRLAARRPGGWRTVWPHIVDFEEAFLRELLRLEPDIIHVHDRHPLAAAASYTALMRAHGRRVPWIYDAHEWLPGQNIPGPPEARIGWLAAEAELIHQADAVISISEDLADRMRARHRLESTPAVVITVSYTH